MDNAVAEKFRNELGITEEQINACESLYNEEIVPIIGRHFLSHLVTTIEELINEKKKRAFLKHIRETIAKENTEFDYTMVEKTVKHKILRLFSIILVPVDSGKLKARTYFIRGGFGVLITYWKQLPDDQIRILIAHELGHVATKYLFDNIDSASDDRLATLFGYIALQDRNNFYKNKAEYFTRKYNIMIYDEIVNICNRINM